MQRVLKEITSPSEPSIVNDFVNAFRTQEVISLLALDINNANKLLSKIGKALSLTEPKLKQYGIFKTTIVYTCIGLKSLRIR